MDTNLHLKRPYLQSNVNDPMPGKPFQSSLIPYQDEIVALRHSKPPVSYARIAELLRQKYSLSIQRAAIGKFVKVRSRGRKVYSFSRRAPEKKPTPAAKKLSDSGLHPPITPVPTTEPRPRGTSLQFMPSDRYSLTRMSPEEAAAIRKKLEEEGH